MESPRPLVALFAAALPLACAPFEGFGPGAGRDALGAGTFDEVSGFGTNPGGLRMYRYLPPGAGPGAPLVVALHGCTQSASAYRAAGWEELADEHGFLVVYPEQVPANHPAGCFNWYADQASLTRGRDENGSVAEMVEWMVDRHQVDRDRVFVTGLSAGAAMSVVMLAAWPDLFAAGASLAGLPYRCADGPGDAFACMSGRDRTPEDWAARARTAYPGWTGPLPPLSVWQGTADYTVSPVNATEVTEQWTALAGADSRADLEDEVEGHSHRVYLDPAGRVAVEVYEVQGGGHATFVVPPEGCGSVGAFFQDAGICSTALIASFFGLTGGPGPLPPGDGGLDGDGLDDGGLDDPAHDGGPGLDGEAAEPEPGAHGGCSVAGPRARPLPALATVLAL